MVPKPSSPRRSPKRSPKRKVLHERSQSQTNQISHRMVNVERNHETISSTPYPTKPAHILLPSSIKNRDGHTGIDGGSFAARVARVKEKAVGGQTHLAIPSSNNANTLGINRSVSELRHLYENQTSSSGSSAAASPSLRGQALAERGSEHEKFLPSELDEFLSLPSPRNASFSIKEIASDVSLPPLPPMPPGPAEWHELSIEDPSSVSQGTPIISSSPNIIALGSSSSVPDEPAAESSSPNYVSLGHSSSQDFASAPHALSLDIVPLQLSPSPAFNPIFPSISDPVQSHQPSSPQSESAATSSSPNVVASSDPNVIAPSSPNVVASSDPNVVAPSSPNVVAFGSSSPNYVSTKYDDAPDDLADDLGDGLVDDLADDSPDQSPDSLRTIKKRGNDTVHEQPSTSTFSTSSEPFNSSPPNQLRPAVSDSTLDLPSGSEAQMTSPALPPSSTFRAHEDLQAALESSPAPEIQYPIVLAPNMDTWEDLNVQKRPPRVLQEDELPGRWIPHLSTVPSEWSQENPLSSHHTMHTEDFSDNDSIPEIPQAAYARGGIVISSSTSILPEADRQEATDIISDLRGPHLQHKTSGFLSIFSGTSSRSNSMRSIVVRRLNSSGSLNSTVHFPAWAHRYYSRGPNDAFYSLRPDTSDSNLSLPSRPSTALSPVTEQSSHSLFRPRTRAGKNARESHILPGIGPLVSNPSQHRLSSLALDPADPRAHWSGAEQAALEAELHRRPPVGSYLANQWSPHLFPDNRASERNRWLAPSIDEKGAPIFAWRNVHMLGFMLGFIFPISWFVAALLPLPTKPAMMEIPHDPEVGGPTLQEQLDHQAATRHNIRYENLRWWRNLNRFMAMVGLVIVSIVVSFCESTNDGVDVILTV
jgi:hypothetical protein